MNKRKEFVLSEETVITKAINSISNISNTVPSTQKHTYNFKGRKSSELAKNLIKEITPKGGKLCDPFMGALSFGIATAENNISFWGCDIDNYTYSVNKALFTKYDPVKFLDYYNSIQRDCKEKVMNLYETKCCNQKNYISKLHFDPEGEKGFETPEYFHPTIHRDIINNESIVLSTKCPICGSSRKIFESIDKQKIEETNALDVSRFPKHKLIENSRINITSTHNADEYDRNFTNRAKYALLLIQDSILNLPESIERDILEHCLVASLTLARICQYGSGSEYIYQVMRKQAQEKNVWEIFSDKVTAFRRFKETYATLLSDEVSNESNLITIKNNDYKSFLSSYTAYFDTIYTDPPYTDQVPYLERSQLYRDWLHTFYDNDNQFTLTPFMLENEIIVTNAPSRAKSKSGLLQYYADIDKMFNLFYSSLKPNGRLVLTIKLGSNKYLLTLAEYIKLARKNGFEYVTKYSIDKKDPTLRKQAAHKNTMMNEMLVFFVKLDAPDTYWFEDDVNIELELTKFLYNELKQAQNGYLPLTKCVSNSQQYLSHTFNLLPSETTQNKIKKTIEASFTVIDNTYVEIDSNRIYAEEDDSDLFAKLYDIIPVIVKKFDTIEGFTKEDLYFELINQLFNGDGNTLEQVINNSNHEKQILALLENYCSIKDSDKFILKKYTETAPIEAVDVSSMDGYDFEKLTKRLLEAKGYYDVIRIGGAGDRGVDLLAKKKTDNIEEGYIIQCKRWIGNVGGTPIQRLHSMMITMSPRISHAICITTSNYTKDAEIESKETGVKIINGYSLMDDLNKYFPGEYYHAIFESI